MFKNCLSFLTFFFFVQLTLGQKPAKQNAVEIFADIQKLNFLGSVLYIAAHPDDENTRLISFLSNEVKARTGYLSLTRGDGGQNLIGPELREALGSIRTQELIEARKIDGGEQFFTRANDFGYSKNPEETLLIWDKNEVLSDIIWQIRNFQPDVIINRFDHRTPGTTHGHHTAASILSLEAFSQVNNETIYPNQLAFTQTWQPKRLFFNTSWWFYGSQEKFEKADKSNLMMLKTGVYYSALGKSNQEIAALSRSCHQSQGFGSTGSRGDDTEYLELIEGEMPKDQTNIFDGIDTTWNRIKGGNEIGILLKNVEQNFDFKNPSSSVSSLLQAYTLIQKLENSYWKNIKLEAITKIIAACAGLYLEAVADVQNTTPNSSVKIKFEAINRSDAKVNLVSTTTLPEQITHKQNFSLENNAGKKFEIDINIPKKFEYTNPYWLESKGTIGMYKVDNQLNIGKPDINRPLKVVFNLTINSVVIPIETTVIYKYNDAVKGEIYKPFDIVPTVTTSFTNNVEIFSNSKSKVVTITVKAGKDNVNGILKLDVPAEWNVVPKSFPFKLDKKDQQETFNFEVTAPKKSTEISAKAVAIVNNEKFDKDKIDISYEHIVKHQILKTSESRFLKLDIKTNNEKIGYVLGAGDEVPQYLSQMNYEVTTIKPDDITPENLKKFDVIIVGIRAYNVAEQLVTKNSYLLDFVKEGKTMIVQYNTAGKSVLKDFAPYPFKISSDRVTEEDAEVRFLDAKHPILNYPNTITSKDFEGWVQERGLYFPSEWSKEYTAIISVNDKNESAKNGAILVAKYGKGHYIYTSLSFFRELPAGVVGAYRLFSNMVSIKN